MIRLVQLQKDMIRRVAVVEEPRLRLLDKFPTIYALANASLAAGGKLSELVRQHAPGDVLGYDPIYKGESEWRLLPPIDHPDEPARCLVSGTGLTHFGGARERDAMHKTAPKQLTDSIKMFQWGVAGGRPPPGRVGIAPEWFYKGNGTILRAHGEPLVVPPYAEDGGEEAEIAGVYLIAPNGEPHRIGMAAGNEFSDHQFEKRNYLNLAASKIRTCALGPELVLEPQFQSVPGQVSIERGGKLLWTKTLRTGEAEMCHSLQNIEHHHFKLETHRRPGDVHVHYFGAHSLSFGAGVQLADGDVMEVRFDGFGRSLRNPVGVAKMPDALVMVQPLA